MLTIFTGDRMTLRRAIIVLSNAALALVVAMTGIVAHRDSAVAAGGALAYSLTSANPAFDTTVASAVAAGDVDHDGRGEVIIGGPGGNQVEPFGGASGAARCSLSTRGGRAGGRVRE